ncbi:hypothetical protein [Rhodoplanes azumiensis]|uniref:Uncharacterized protein n=1 Tax=Rhodoplanes azumiensis TaxID=1897628 RepID=A0ABW5AE44_9BRAD
MKRSTQVGLVLMSALGVGGTAYMLMPGRDCRPPDTPEQAALHAPLAPGAAAAAPVQQQNCAPRGSSGSSGRWSSGSSWWHGGSSSSSSRTGPVVAKAASGTASSTASSSSGIGSTLRSGFGSFARAVSSGG